MSHDTYPRPKFSSQREARQYSIDELCRQLGVPLFPRNGKDGVGDTFNALTALKNDYTRRASITSSYPEQIGANGTAEQLGALLNALDALRDTAVWGKVLKAFKGFGGE